MRITCPYCGSRADVTPNPTFSERGTGARYILKCSGCDQVAVKREPVSEARAAR